MTGRAYYLPPRSFENLLKGLRTKTGTDRIRGSACDGPRFDEGHGSLEFRGSGGFNFGVGRIVGSYDDWTYTESSLHRRTIRLEYCTGGGADVYER